ncbi:MAG: ABC transporter permease, partial [Anaerolineae bacterium]
MRAYLVKRFLMTVLVLVLVTVYLTLLVYIVPGDPAKTILGPRANPDRIAKIRAAMHLDEPVLKQVGLALWSLARLDLGTDMFTGKDIGELVGAALPHTLILAWSSLTLAVVIGIPLGIYSATHPDSWLDRITAIISIS